MSAARAPRRRPAAALRAAAPCRRQGVPRTPPAWRPGQPVRLLHQTNARPALSVPAARQRSPPRSAPPARRPVRSATGSRSRSGPAAPAARPVRTVRPRTPAGFQSAFASIRPFCLPPVRQSPKKGYKKAAPPPIQRRGSTCISSYYSANRAVPVRSAGAPSCRASKCRCGPVELPVLPTYPKTWP